MMYWDGTNRLIIHRVFSVCGMNAGYMPTKMLYDNLTNFAGSGIEDPRADKSFTLGIFEAIK